jgi:hypothetical protein
MADLLRDLERYGRHLESTAPPISVAEIRHRHAGAAATGRRVPAWAAALAGAVAMLVVLGGLSFVLGGSEGATEPSEPAAPTTTAPVPTTVTTTFAGPADPVEPFAWGEDLARWVTEDEMTALLGRLSRKYYMDTGGSLGGEAVLSRPGGDLVWSVGYWSIGVHDGGGWHPTPDTTDPRLPTGVLYTGDSQSHGFSGPASSAAICLTVTTPGTTASIEEEPNYQSIVFEIATMMLEEMGWTHTSTGD